MQGGFFGNISIEKAIFDTIEEADELENCIKEVAEKGRDKDHSTLYDLVFRPLHKNDTSAKHVESKAYGLISPSWLRIYAVQIAPNLYVDSGGAIKLTKTMQERSHTAHELKKLKATVACLKEQGFENTEDYVFIDIRTP